MTAREYIGARYIPLFMGDWDITATYEPLSVVSYQGNSYTSRQTVPSGIDIENTDYWFESGSYNAQVEQYRQEVLTFNNRIETLENDLPTSDYDSVNTVSAAISAEATTRENADTALDTRIDAIEDALPISDYSSVNTVSVAISAEATSRENADTALGGRITDETTARENADTAITNNITQRLKEYTFSDMVTGGNAVFIGDSYTYGTGASDHGSGDTKRWSSIVCAHLNLTEFNFAVGATGFVKPSTAANNFDVQLQRAIDTLTTTQKANTKLVFIQGGYNDAKTGVGASALYTACKSLCQQAANAFSNAIIVVVPMLWPAYEFTQTDYYRTTELESGAFLSEKPSVLCMHDAWTWFFGQIETHISSDHIHPNDAGHGLIAFRVIGGLIGNHTSKNRLLLSSPENGYHYTSETNQGFYQWLHDGRVYSEMGRVTNDPAMTANQPHTIGTLNNGAAPRQNIYVPIYVSDVVQGVCAFLSSGSIVVKPYVNIGAGAGFNIGSTSWLPYGKLP